MKRNNGKRAGFTLVELLVVIGILIVLVLVTLFFVNPAQLASQGRDTNRVSDLTSLSQNVALYHETNPAGSLGSSSVLYISIPDPTATSTAGDQCQGLGLPTSTFTYHCAASSTYRDVNGTGWVPINFSAISGASLATLPIDPINTTSSNEYYVYTASGTDYELIANPESQKSASSSFTQGNDLALTSFPGTTVYFTTSTYASVAPAGSDGDWLVFDSHTNTMWFPNFSDTIQVNDTTYATSTSPVALPDDGIAFDSHTNTIWGEAWYGDYGTAIQVNDTTYATSTFIVDTSGNNVAFDSHTNTLWYSAYGNGITILNDTTYATTTLSGLGNSGALTFDSHTNTIWFADGGIINDTTYATSTYPDSGWSIAFDSHTNSIWLTAPAGNCNTVTQINDTTFATTTYTVEDAGGCSDSDSIAFDPHTNTIWVADSNDGVLTVFTPNQ